MGARTLWRAASSSRVPWVGLGSLTLGGGRGVEASKRRSGRPAWVRTRLEAVGPRPRPPNAPGCGEPRVLAPRGPAWALRRGPAPSSAAPFRRRGSRAGAGGREERPSPPPGARLDAVEGEGAYAPRGVLTGRRSGEREVCAPSPGQAASAGHAWCGSVGVLRESRPSLRARGAGSCRPGPVSAPPCFLLHRVPLKTVEFNLEKTKPRGSPLSVNACCVCPGL